VVNLAPFSYFAPLTNAPILLAVSFGWRADGSRKDSERNLRASGELVINICPPELLDRMNACAAPLGQEESEAERFQVEMVAARRVRPPRVRDAWASFECVVEECRDLPVARHTLVLARAVWLAFRDDLAVDGRPAAERIRPVGRVGSAGYVVGGDFVRLAKGQALRAGAGPEGASPPQGASQG
jgi:flavin reductase (DIM6/NTAB) family NADH-FMN oxidoreductase RutF